MTAKRFNSNFQGDTLVSVNDTVKNKNVNIIQIIEIANNLSEENEQLKKEVDMLSCELSVSANKTISKDCRIQELVKENEELKKENELLKKRYPVKNEYKLFEECYE